MKPTRRLCALILSGAIIVLTLILILVQRTTRSMPDVKETDGVVRGEIVPLEKSGLSGNTLKPYSARSGIEGIAAVLRDGYREGTPLVEIHFLRRGLDGSTELFPLSSVEVSPLTGYGGSTGLNGAHGLILSVNSDPNDRAALRLGTGYRITYYTPFSGGPAVKPIEPYPSFQVPQDLPPSSVYRVKLIIKDEIMEQQVLAQKHAEAEEMKRIAVEEQIVVRATDDLPGYLVGVYHDGTKSREFYSKEGERSLVLKGPNKLGGELAVYAMGADSRTQEAWAYTPKLDKRQVDMPKDAQLMVKQSDLIPITISLSRPRAELFSRYRRVAFYFSEATHWPLFTAGLPPWPTQEEPGAIPVSIQVKPGTYAVRLMGDKMESLAVTMLTIASEPSRTYTVELPTQSPASMP